MIKEDKRAWWWDKTDKKWDQNTQHYNQEEQRDDKEDKYIGHTINTLEFLIHSSTSCHIINSNNGIKRLKKISSQIVVAYNFTSNATKTGKIILKVEGLDNKIQLEKVHTVLLFNKKNINVKQLTKQRYQIMFKNQGARKELHKGNSLK